MTYDINTVEGLLAAAHAAKADGSSEPVRLVAALLRREMNHQNLVPHAAAKRLIARSSRMTWECGIRVSRLLDASTRVEWDRAEEGFVTGTWWDLAVAVNNPAYIPGWYEEEWVDVESADQALEMLAD